MSPTDILPARMVNEFVYCPRLFYYEHVEGLFVHNADTLLGKTQHRVVDGKESGLPNSTTPPLNDSTTPPESIHARSVSLFSENLGVSAKLDLVEGASDLTTGQIIYQPVEYKKGRPREGIDGQCLWDADRVQLGLQILLLRENGYSCTSGLVFYRETRQRVSYELTDEEEEWVRQQVEQARATAQRPQIPPPLNNSPKCPRCSLVGICLPDETRFLHEETAPGPTQSLLPFFISPDEDIPRPPPDPFGPLPEIAFPRLKPNEDVRRLIAPNPDSRTLYLNTPGYMVGISKENLVVKEKGKKIAEFRLIDIHHLGLFGPVQISAQAVHGLCERDIPITYFSMGGWFYGMTRGHTLKNVFTRIEQFRTISDLEAALPIARLMVMAKIRNQRTLLMRNHIEAPARTLQALRFLARSALAASDTSSLLGIEGSAANFYFEAFPGMLKNRANGDSSPAEQQSQQTFSFTFKDRNRRPPKDPVNALLSLGYSLLAKDCTLAAYAVGFDPYVGFFHQPRFGRPALALDLMEEFRPLVVESMVLSLINNQRIREDDFIQAGEAVTLSPQARKKVFFAYEQRMSTGVTHPVFNYKVSYRRAIELQARLLAKHLTGEIDAYIPFLTR